MTRPTFDGEQRLDPGGANMVPRSSTSTPPPPPPPPAGKPKTCRCDYAKGGCL